VALAASATACAVGESPEYRFAYRRDATTTLVELQGWSPTATSTWNTEGLPSGSYHAYVYVRASGSPKSQSSDSAVVLVGQVCHGVTLAVDADSPQSVGAVLGLSAQASCTGSTPEYQFVAKPPAGPAVILRDWSDVATATWDTSTAPAGPHRLTVSARASGNLGFEAQSSTSFRLGETCEFPTLGAQPPSPAAAGTLVSLSATAACTGGVEPQFRFTYRPSAASTWTILRDWSDAAETTWQSDGLVFDDYRLRIEARANDYAGPPQSYAMQTYVIGPWCSAISFDVSPKSPPALDAVLALSANASCSGAAAEYRFWWRAPGATEYVELRGWGAPTASFDTTNAVGGAYSFKVQARALGNVASYQAQRALSYRLGHVCSKVTLAASPSSPSLAGTTVGLTATSTCANGGVPEYRFVARAAGSEGWTVVRDWGPGSASWNTTNPPWSPGDYQIRAEVRGQGQSGGAEAVRTIGHSLVQGGCLVDSIYDIAMTHTETGLFRRGSWGECGTASRSYHSSVRAMVTTAGVQISGSIFAGTYTIVENGPQGFTAEATEGNGFTCEDDDEYTDGAYGSATVRFDCATAAVTFEGSCAADEAADGCYPNYFNSATGTGIRVLTCAAGYHLSGGACVDTDECASAPCPGAETCANTPGAYTCSCLPPAETCGGACVSTNSDVLNCGACGNRCADGDECSEGTCALSCPAGYQHNGNNQCDVPTE
jgi:hypothetical protein